MRYADFIITILFGLFWFVFGLNNFLHFFPVPQPAPGGAAFVDALNNTGYVLPIVYITQIIAGLLLLARRFVPLALLILAPVVANIILYDLFLNPSGLLIGAIVTILYAFLLFQHRKLFMHFLKP
ncbi:MAG: hypothetical protein IT558_01565 [Alphaproteobacteria bacterium]|nr:hypothetical protein [Alphaproteobacteria bacterium]